MMIILALIYYSLIVSLTEAFVAVRPKTARVGLPCRVESKFAIATLGDGGFFLSSDVSDSFTDEVNLFGDPTIQAMVGAFGVVVLLLFVFNLLIGKMDNAIESVLLDFERVMSTKYSKQWSKIEKELEGLDEAARTKKLYEVMEEYKEQFPELMDKVNEDMNSTS